MGDLETIDLVYVLLVRDFYDREYHIEGVYRKKEDAQAAAESYEGQEPEIREEYVF